MFVLRNGRRCALLASSLLACSLVVRSARASDDGQGVGFGPLLSFSADDSIYVGWELAGAGNILFRGSLGGAYRVVQQHSDDPAFFHYVAWEPWGYVGGTLGLALTDPQPRVMYGLWEGLGQSLSGVSNSVGGGLFDSTELQWVFSIAIGWRGVGSTQTFYLTPKLWRMHGWQFSS
ncbi:MAG TPA: hypothetical protein VFS67_22215 [Polyangiaceae bacterium]|jgi:hypothetical protein|nr:hypothetical protein [Polyangiaceae bacterium]